MSLVLEKLDLRRHDVEKAAELAYGADETLLPLMFGGKATATRRIACLIRAGGNVFGYEHIYVAIDDGKVVGIAIGDTGSEYEKADGAGFGLLYRCLSITGTLRLLAALPIVNRVLTNRFEADDFYLGILAVDPDRRSGGIGTFAIEGITRIAREKGCNSLVLDVSFENPRAKKFYERLGFECVGKRPLIPGWGKIGTCTMVKML
ncbi:GNAT family N-acetyltransferase [Methanocella sp. MCL-LM]|uniref:GNAT family N-acetyltransferase n=1 Tax=Methanocella sp. MCL-LM TaxID=3412035 RepID=UPI003C781166